MAVIFEDKYHKITKTVTDFVNNTTEIEMNVYSSEDTRNLEKNIEDKRAVFKGNVHNLLEQNMLNLMEKTSKIKPVDEIDDAEAFFKDHPDIEREYKEVQAIQDEGLELADKITTIDINIEELQFKDLWIKLGLDDDLCKRINYLGTKMIGVDGIQKAELPELYNAIKTKMVGRIIDC